MPSSTTSSAGGFTNFNNEINSAKKSTLQRPFSAVYTQGMTNNIENADIQTRNAGANTFYAGNGDTLQRH